MNQKKIIDIDKNSDLYTRKPPKRVKEKIRNLFFSVFICLVILTIFYFSLPVSRISVIYFNDLEFVNRSALIELAGVSENDYFLGLNLQEISKKLESHALIDQAIVTRSGINSLVVQIAEKKIMGCVELEGDLLYVFSDGQTISKNDDINPICQGIIIYGLTQSDLDESILHLFVKALEDVDPAFISLINEIKYEPQFGDVNRFSLILKDGNTVKVNSYSMAERLNAYQRLVEIIADRQGEDVIGIFNLDVGLFFEPYQSTGSADRVEIDDEVVNTE